MSSVPTVSPTASSVQSLQSNSALRKAGVREGFVLLTANNVPLRSQSDLNQVVSALDKAGSQSRSRRSALQLRGFVSRDGRSRVLRSRSVGPPSYINVASPRARLGSLAILLPRGDAVCMGFLSVVVLQKRLSLSKVNKYAFSNGIVE